MADWAAQESHIYQPTNSEIYLSSFSTMTLGCQISKLFLSCRIIGTFSPRIFFLLHWEKKICLQMNGISFLSLKKKEAEKGHRISQRVLIVAPIQKSPKTINI